MGWFAHTRVRRPSLPHKKPSIGGGKDEDVAAIQERAKELSFYDANKIQLIKDIHAITQFIEEDPSLKPLRAQLFNKALSLGRDSIDLVDTAYGGDLPELRSVFDGLYEVFDENELAARLQAQTLSEAPSAPVPPSVPLSVLVAPPPEPAPPPPPPSSKPKINEIEQWVVGQTRDKSKKGNITKDELLNSNGAEDWIVVNVPKDIEGPNSLLFSLLISCSPTYRKLLAIDKFNLVSLASRSIDKNLQAFSDKYNIGIVVFLRYKYPGNPAQIDQAILIKPRRTETNSCIMLSCRIRYKSQFKAGRWEILETQIKYAPVSTNTKNFVILMNRLEPTEMPIDITEKKVQDIVGRYGTAVEILEGEKEEEEKFTRTYLEPYSGTFKDYDVDRIEAEFPAYNKTILQHIREGTYKTHKNQYVANMKSVKNRKNVPKNLTKRLGELMDRSAFGLDERMLRATLRQHDDALLKQIAEAEAIDTDIESLEAPANSSVSILGTLMTKSGTLSGFSTSAQAKEAIQQLKVKIDNYIKTNPGIQEKLKGLQKKLDSDELNRKEKEKLTSFIQDIKQSGKRITDPYLSVVDRVGRAVAEEEQGKIVLWPAQQQERLQLVKINENKIAEGFMRPEGWGVELWNPQTGTPIPGSARDKVDKLKDACDKFDNSQIPITYEPLGTHYKMKNSTTMYDFLQLLFLNPLITLDEMVAFYFVSGRPSAGCDSYETLARLFVFLGGISTIIPQEGGNYTFIEKIELNAKDEYSIYSTSWEMLTDTKCLATKGSGLSDISLVRNDVVDVAKKSIKSTGVSNPDQKKVYKMSVKWYESEKSPEYYDAAKLHSYKMPSIDLKDTGILVFLKNRSEFTEKCMTAARDYQARLCEQIYGWHEDVKPFLNNVRTKLFEIADSKMKTPLQVFDELYGIHSEFIPKL